MFPANSADFSAISAVKGLKDLTAKFTEDSQRAQRKSALKTKSSFPEKWEKRLRSAGNKFAHPESHVPRTFRVESWHLAAAIYDPGPVAVAS
jgi:hypothetical protein